MSSFSNKICPIHSYHLYRRKTFQFTNILKQAGHVLYYRFFKIYSTFSYIPSQQSSFSENRLLTILRSKSGKNPAKNVRKFSPPTSLAMTGITSPADSINMPSNSASSSSSSPSSSASWHAT
mgnify:CR=1 FL=1